MLPLNKNCLILAIWLDFTIGAKSQVRTPLGPVITNKQVDALDDFGEAISTFLK
jgi:hypothetical protein